MNTRTFGRSGIEVGPLALGGNVFGGVDIRRDTSGRPYRAPPVRTRRFGGSCI
jgi:hypothetical protein